MKSQVAKTEFQKMNSNQLLKKVAEGNLDEWQTEHVKWILEGRFPSLNIEQKSNPYKVSLHGLPKADIDEIEGDNLLGWTSLESAIEALKSKGYKVQKRVVKYVEL